MLLLALLCTLHGFAEEPAPYRGFRADLDAAGLVARIHVGKRDPGSVDALVGRVFKGGAKEGDTVTLAYDAESYEERLSGDLACPGGILGNGVPFFGKLPAAGGSCIALARRTDHGWALEACCLAEPAGGLSFESAEQAKAYGEERRRAADKADALVAALLAAKSDADYALACALALAANFAEEGCGDADLAAGVLLDDARRFSASLDRDNAALRDAVARAHAFILDGGAAKNAQAAALREWLVPLLTEAQRREAAAYYAAEYRKARREADEDGKQRREPKDPRRKPEPDRFEDTAARRFGLQSRLKELPKLLALALDPIHPPTDLSNDDLLEKADALAPK